MLKNTTAIHNTIHSTAITISTCNIPWVPQLITLMLSVSKINDRMDINTLRTPSHSRGCSPKLERKIIQESLGITFQYNQVPQAPGPFKIMQKIKQVQLLPFLVSLYPLNSAINSTMEAKTLKMWNNIVSLKVLCYWRIQAEVHWKGNASGEIFTYIASLVCQYSSETLPTFTSSFDLSKELRVLLYHSHYYSS